MIKNQHHKLQEGIARTSLYQTTTTSINQHAMKSMELENRFFKKIRGIEQR
jgi:predicted DNA-binding ribbon-helix-helix protein